MKVDHVSVFANKVYQALGRIPRGRVTTYRAVAMYIGSPHAARAVGTALGNNPHLVAIPCHRVIASDRSIGGYAEGVEKKITLLRQEGVEVDSTFKIPALYILRNL